MDVAKTLQMLTRLDGGDLTMYKVVRVTGDEVRSLYQDFTYKPGCNQSDRLMTDLSVEEKLVPRIYKGIHVYTSLAKAIASDNWSYQVILPVIVTRDALVAVGDNEDAVFTKVYVKRKDLMNTKQAAKSARGDFFDKDHTKIFFNDDDYPVVKQFYDKRFDDKRFDTKTQYFYDQQHDARKQYIDDRYKSLFYKDVYPRN